MAGQHGVDMGKIAFRGKELSVGLLLSDLLVAKQFSRIFRKVGVVPYIYENLQEVMHERAYPSLLIADVTLMSDGESVLADLPVIKQERLPLAFYYTEKSKPLLVSTYNLFHLGLISGDGALEGQVKGVLKRLNHLFRLEEDSARLRYIEQQHKREVRSLYQRTEQFKQFHFYNEELSRITRLIEGQKVQGDFYLACEKVFDNESVISAFTYFELSLTGQKLITPTSMSKKFNKIPSLWLKDPCPKGIDDYAQNLAAQVATELMGDNLVAIHLRAEFSRPSALLFLQINDSEFMELFDWELFETYLNGLYAYFSLNKRKSIQLSTTHNTNMFDIFSLLDDQMYAALSGKSMIAEEEWKVIHLDFSRLLDFVVDDPQIRFYWRSFYKDFIKLLFEKSDIDFSFSTSGVVNLTFVVQEDDKEEFFSVLKEHINTFSYWRYFEDSDLVLTKNFIPDLRMIPNSTKAVKDFILGSKDSLYVTTPTRTIDWSSETNQVDTPTSPKRIEGNRSLEL